MLIGSKTMQSEHNDFMLACYRLRRLYAPYSARISRSPIRDDVRNRITLSTEESRQDWYTVY